MCYRKNASEGFLITEGAIFDFTAVRVTARKKISQVS